jgi:hypothetical protein
MMQNIINIISLVLFSQIASISLYILSLSVFNYLVSNYEMLVYYIINYGFIITSIVYFITFPIFISTNYIAYIERKNGMKH